jgi:4-diphosphocytidyl-2-C-methyl-D-erythritol kinase
MISIPSFAKINLGLKIGPARPDGFHELRTVYQTLALHDVIRVEVVQGEGIEIRCCDPRVPLDASNTCYKVAEQVMAAVSQGKVVATAGEQQILRLRSDAASLRSAQDDNFNGEASRSRSAQDENFKGVRAQADDSKEVRAQDHNIGQRGDGASDSASVPLQPGVDTNLYGTAHAARVQRELLTTGRNKIVIEIEKHLPVQGGMGAASSNAVATMLAMERALGVTLAAEDKVRIAAEVGSDLPLFLIGGTVLGVGRGEEVFPLPDLPTMHVVVVTPPVGVSTPRAFARWDDLAALEAGLTHSRPAGTIDEFSQRVFAWLRAGFPQVGRAEVSERIPTASGVPARGGDRAETPLLDLVRAGIENDFEKVVFPEYPDLREVKAVLLREGARYASLSGSGSTLYGIFETQDQAQTATDRISAAGHAAVATTTLTRAEYWTAVVSRQ